MAEIYPKLRSDLEIRPESQEPRAPLIVKDPVARQFFRFTSIQGAVLRRLDGRQSLSTIAEEVARDHATAVTRTQLEDFVGKLQALGLLENPAPWEKLDTTKGPDRRILRDILSIKIKAFNPDVLLTRLEKRLRFCFSRAFVGAVCATLITAIVIAVHNSNDLFVSVENLLNLHSVPLIFLVAFSVLTIHEFAHGLTLKHYGGKVPEMGLMLLYFIPAFYCDVSDAWLLGKRERVWVTFAGGFVQLFVGALAVIVWRLVSQETLLSHICLITFAFAGIQTLFNFNPLIRLDGYYLLSDYLGIPNLRAKAFTFLRDRLATLVLGTPTDRESLSIRERRIYWRYGLASALFTGGLIGFMISRLGGWLVREYQVWGLLLTSLLGLMSVQIIVNSSGITATLRFFTALADRVRKTPRMWVTMALLFGGSLLPWELKVSGDFSIRSTERVSVNSQVDGTLRAIYVNEGGTVAPGDVLAEIENLELKNDYEDIRGELAGRSATLKLLRAGARPEEIERARKHLETKKAELANVSRIEKERALLQETVGKKQAELQNAKEVFERSKTLFTGGLISRNEYDRDYTHYQVRQRELSEAQSQLGVLAEKMERELQVKKKEVDESESALKLLQAGTRIEAIEEAEAEVAKLQEKVSILEQQLDLLKIRSTIEGVVATRHLRNRLGEYIRKGDFFCEIVNIGKMIVEMPVPEKEIADVRIGFPITLKVRGFPDRSFEARVSGISPIALEDDAQRKIIVQSELDNPSGILKTGMTGVGKILCGKRMIAYLMTRRAVRWLRTEFWEYLP